VVDAETVEACRAALAPFVYGEDFDDLEFLDAQGEAKLLPMALAVLDAVHIEMADEVVEVRADSRVTVGFDTPERAVMISLERGDTLYIVRAVTADCHSKEE